MQFFVDGHVWEATRPGGPKPMAGRQDAFERLSAVSPLGKRTSHYSAAWAAYKVADYSRAIECAELADLRGEKSERG